MGEAREHAAHGLELEAEVGADFGTRHAQHELAAGVAAVFEALGERQEEGGKTLLGVHGAEQQHHAVLAHDFAREQLLEVLAHRLDRGRRLFDAVEGEDADLRVLERDDVAGVDVARNAIKADHLAGHEEVGDLLATVAAHDGALQEAEANHIEIVKVVAGTVERLAATDAAAGGDKLLHRLHILERKAERHADLSQVAVRTANAQCRDIHLAPVAEEGPKSGHSPR